MFLPILIENSFALPLADAQEQIRINGLRVFASKRSPTARCEDIMEIWNQHPGTIVVSLDFSSFDGSLDWLSIVEAKAR